MTTLKQALEEFMDQTGTGFHDTADSVTAAGIVDVSRFQRGASGANRYRGWWVERPTVTGNNVVKQGGKIATDTWTHTSSSYTDALTELYYRGWRPDWHPTDYVKPLANRSLRYAWQWWRSPLSIISNGDGEASSVGGTDSSATTTRTTTAASVHSGAAALNVANSGANGYHAFDVFDAAAGRSFRLSAWVRITTAGVAKIQIVNSSDNDAVIASETVSGVGQMHYLQLSGTFPSNCYKAQVRVGADEATAVTVWDDVFCLWEPMTLIAGPSWVNEWTDENGSPAFRLYRQRNRLTGDGADAGRAYDLELVDERDYQVLNVPSAANPAEFELGRKLSADIQSLIIEARRPYDSFNSSALSADTDTSGCSLDLWVAAMKWRAAEERNLPQAGEWYRDYLREQYKGMSMLRTPPMDNPTGLRTTVMRI